MPSTVKQGAIAKLVDYRRRMSGVTRGIDRVFLENGLDVIVERLRQESSDVAERRREFVKFTKALDRFNGHSILDVCPELAPLFDDSPPNRQENGLLTGQPGGPRPVH